MGELPEEPLGRALESTLVDCVCRLGVDFGRALGHEHYAKVLQFVPGLGARKSAKLLREVQAASATKNAPASREELRQFLTDAVHFNAVGFVKFLPPQVQGGLQHGQSSSSI